MAVGLSGLPELYPVAGVRWATAAAGIKKKGGKDLALMAIEPGASVAGVYTRNAFCAAPVIVAREHGAGGRARYLLINSGNANAGTGEPGMAAARASCAALAELGECDVTEVLPFSTGVIGEPLPVEKIRAALPGLLAGLEAGWVDAAHAIMTTDTLPKGASRRVQIGDQVITITGISKGSGMIRPDMATMLAYVATDAEIPPGLLQAALTTAADQSFNCITVDGDTSTNDACVLAATGKGGVSFSSSSDEGYADFQDALNQVCETLAQAIVRDGEGATKFITIAAEGGRDTAECRQVAETVAHSPLVKTALFASDPNWGRILAAVGRAGVADLDVNAIEIHLNGVCIVRDGGRASDYTEEAGQAAMAPEEITISINLHRGEAALRIWTCDFSYEYVRINAEYRS